MSSVDKNQTVAQAAESAGRDADRIVKWSDRIQRAHPKSEPEFWPDALRVKYMADEISDLRAARTPVDSVQEDAARYRFLRDGEWRDTDLEPFIRLQLNTLWDAKIDAARAAQEGGK